MKNEKGFTLIELLAVIVILAIIALIATPIILNVIEDAKKNAAIDSAYGYIEAIEFNNSMAGVDEDYQTITETDVTQINTKVNVKGMKPTSGTITLDVSGRVTGATLIINGYEVKYDGEKATVEGKKDSEPEKQPEETVTGPTSENPDTTKTKGLIKIVYLDPTDLTKNCTKEIAENNLNENGTPTGITSGCMKWYAYKDDGTNYNMILDHNTTVTVAYNTADTGNTEKNKVQEQLEKLVSESNWKSTPKLITADEIATITGANLDTTIKWNSSKLYGTDNIEKSSAWFYLDGSGITYSSTDGWQKQVSTTEGSSKYAWLYDNTFGCTSYGCNIEDNTNLNDIYGYWTNTLVSDDYNSAWIVHWRGNLVKNTISISNMYGIRPVITVEKSLIK